MRLKSITLQNIAKHRDTHIEFDNHPLFVVVAPNETGKSYLIGAAYALLYGEFPGSTSIYEEITWGEKAGYLQGIFEDKQGTCYEAERVIKTNRSTVCNIWQLDEDGKRIEPQLAGPKVSDYKVKVIELFGEPYTFLAASLAAQDGVGDITTADRAKRYAILTELNGATHLIDLGEKIKKAGVEFAKEVQTCAEKYRQQAELSQLPEEVPARIKAIEEDQDKLRGLIAAAGLEKEYSQEKISRLNHVKESLDQLAQQCAQAVKDKEAADARVAEQYALVTIKQLALQKLPDMQERVKTLEHDENELVKLRGHQSRYGIYLQHKARLDGLNGQLEEVNKRGNMLSNLLRNEPEHHRKLLEYNRMTEQLRILDAREQPYQERQAEIQQYQTWRQAMQSKIEGCKSQIEGCSKSAEMLNQIPDPQNVCQRCPLVTYNFQAAATLPSLTEELRHLTEQLATIPAPEPFNGYDPQKHMQLRSQASFTYNSLKEEKQQLQQLHDEQAALKESWTQLNQQIQDLGPVTPLEDKSQALAALEQKIAESRLFLQDLPRLDIMSKELPDDQRRLEEARAHLAQMEERVKAMPAPESPDALNAQIAAEQKLLAERVAEEEALRLKREQNLVELGTLEQRTQTAALAAAKAAELREVLSVMETRKARLETLAFIFSKKGAIPLLIEQTRPQIEMFANDLLQRVAGSAETLSLRTISDTGQEVMDIKVLNDHGEHDLDQFSGGKKKMLRSAMRFGVVRWAQASGRGLGMLSVDETFDSLDPENTRRMFEMLQDIAEDIPQVAVISHTEDIAHAFPERLLLAYDGSKVESKWN